MMSKYPDNSTGSHLYELCKEFYKYEQNLLKVENDTINKCYLIDSNSIDNLKKQIRYDELKEYIKNDISKENFTKITKDLSNKIKIDLSPKAFKTSDDLIKSLNNENQYYYITPSLCSKLCKIKKFENYAIKYSIHKNKIEFIFNDNSSIQFLSNLLGLIEKSLLVKDSQTKINNSYSSEKHQKDEQNVKNDLEILIRLFYFNKFLKEKDNLDFKPLKKENYQLVYLINNDWLEKFKSFYDYNELENYLLKSKNESYIIGLDFITEKSIQKIIYTLPETYINNIENKGKFDKCDKKINRYENDKIIEKKIGIKSEISYLINNQIINKKIHDALMKAEYETSETPLKNCDIYFIGDKRVMLLFKPDVINDNNEIGYINDKYIFIPEFILFKEDNNFSIDNLNFFFQKSFSSFTLNQGSESCYILDKNNSKIGKCFRINNNKPEDKSKNLNKQSQIKSKKAPLDGLEDVIQKHIELFMEFYLFYAEMNKKINQSLFISKRENYYIIKKKWTNKFSEYFEYNKFIENINKGNINGIIDKYKADNNYSNFLIQLMKLLPYDYKKNIKAKIEDKNSLKYFSNVEHFNIQLINKEIKSGKPSYYYYYSDIDIINNEIFNLIKELFILDCQEEERIFMIGDNKIIMDFKLVNQLSLIVGNYIDNNFKPDILFVFEKEEYLDNFF